jgi:two-component system, cell cycle sensor histidine kinase and response regulator CckA
LPPTDSRANRPRTILVVDDEDLVRELLARTLREAGYRVLEASHGTGAIGLLEPQSNAVDLVICDLVMPVLGGKEVAEWIRQHSPAVPLLFISGYPRAYLEAHHLYDPQVPMLRKPFLPSRLLEAVEEQVAAHPPVERRRSQRGADRESPRSTGT